MKLKVGEIMREPKSLENSNKHPAIGQTVFIIEPWTENILTAIIENILIPFVDLKVSHAKNTYTNK